MKLWLTHLPTANAKNPLGICGVEIVQICNVPLHRPKNWVKVNKENYKGVEQRRALFT